MSKLQESGAISLKHIADEFDIFFGSSILSGTQFNNVDDNESASKYYRGGTYVPDISFNKDIPTQGEVSLSDYYGTKAKDFVRYAIPAYETNYFKTVNGAVTTRILGTFTTVELTDMSFSVRVRIMGDERESDCFTSTNRQYVENPTIEVAKVTSDVLGVPTAWEVKFGQNARVSSNNDDAYVYANLAASAKALPADTYVVLASMYCVNQGGPDAPLSRWYNPSFTIATSTA